MSNEQNPFESTADIGETVAAPAKQRPTSATVLGVINIVFGLLGILSGVLGLVFLLLMVSGAMPVPDEVAVQQVTSPMAIGSAVLGLVLSIVLVIAGWGLIQFKPFGRTLSVWYAILSILFAVIGIGIGIFELPGAIDAFQNVDPNDPQALNAAMTPIVAVVSNCVSLIYPIILLIFMNRRSFVEAIQGTNRS